MKVRWEDQLLLVFEPGGRDVVALLLGPDMGKANACGEHMMQDATWGHDDDADFLDNTGKHHDHYSQW